jgi:VWFA-related protein
MPMSSSADSDRRKIAMTLMDNVNACYRYLRQSSDTVKALLHAGDYMLRVTALTCLFLLASVHAQDNDFQRWVLVTPPKTVSVSDVKFGDIEVLQDGHLPKQGRPTIQQEAPFRIGLVFDESGSGRSLPSHDGLLEHVLGWAGDTMQRRKGDAFLVGFNDQIVISTEITTDPSQLRHALSQLRPLGGSAIRDAIIHSAQKFDSVRQESQPTARLLVVVTDGHDNASYAKERGVIESVQRSGVRVYVIGLPYDGIYEGKGLMEHLSSDTGGQAFFPADQNELDRDLAAIERALTNSFLIGFVPEAHDGKAHKLTVRLPKAGSINLGYMPVFYAPSERDWRLRAR